MDPARHSRGPETTSRRWRGRATFDRHSGRGAQGGRRGDARRGGAPRALAAFAGDIESGATIFAGNCAACHAGGNNVIAAEKTLRKEALDSYLAGGRKESSVVTQVTNGKNAMPAFGGRLSDEEIGDVAAYVIDQANGARRGDERRVAASGPVLPRVCDGGETGRVYHLFCPTRERRVVDASGDAASRTGGVLPAPASRRWRLVGGSLRCAARRAPPSLCLVGLPIATWFGRLAAY